MSDAQLPPGVHDAESDAPLPSGLHFAEEPVTDRQRPPPDSGSAVNVPVPAEPVSSQGALRDLGPEPDSVPAAREFDELQPMLDLGFPEEEGRPPPLPDNDRPELEVDAQPVVASCDELPASGDGVLDAAAQPDAEGDGSPEPTGGISPDSPTGIGVAMEISPIFRAADAIAQAAQPGPPPVVDPFEIGILVPRSDAMAVAPEHFSADEVGVADDAEPPVELDASPEAGLQEDGSAGPEQVQHDDRRAPENDETRPAELLQEAAARIAVEASATAAALENLKRLLVHKLPMAELAPAPSDEPERSEEEATQRTEPPPIPAYQAPVHLPVSPPPMLSGAMASLAYAEANDPPRRSAAAVGSFLAGFALSWVLGAVLYVFLSAG